MAQSKLRDNGNMGCQVSEGGNQNYIGIFTAKSQQTQRKLPELTTVFRELVLCLAIENWV